ncbi:hypothetical protein DL766_009768 [Monosporascus sp. MC13-8B]|uniref:Uncharacterized protein n=1 Tax=Monosporascus cannonballus TaxID=155416 RepID=A0ABY0H3E1_9PEZI|nr:hypothetical protein DL762_007197 [Monosporascus cannonballus]RYO84564.1 hypothetical protein DL763_007416 [Monosporascus cannonballus]RYP14087.1 hypothetical protein DL766_009768 [Monosporascus sp. MC13-8B]
MYMIFANGTASLTGPSSIWGKLFVPAHDADAENVTTVQFLTHGGTLNHTHWDIAPGYSYMDAAWPFIFSVLEIAFADRQTTTVGELITTGEISGLSPDFTGPLQVVLDFQDFPFCSGDCSSLED